MPPPQPVAAKEEPWGQEDPLLWCARRVRRLALFSSATIAFVILLFGAGIYSFFTTLAFEGEEGLQDSAGWILFVLAPFLLAIIGGILTAVLARNVGRLSRQPGAPTGASKAKWVLWISALLWFLLIIVFIVSAVINSEPDNPDEDSFPIGLFTLLPAYMGFCLAVFTSGAAMAAGSEENKLETILVVGLGWAAFVVFLILPGLLSSWSIGSTEDLDWDSVIFWLRFGNLFPAILPWLIVLTLNWTHGKSIDELEFQTESNPTAAPTLTTDGPGDGRCASCGGALTVHPRTQEIFCTACGAGLSKDEIVVDAEPPDYEFVEQQRPPDVTRAPAPTHDQLPTATVMASTTPGPGPAQPTPRYCTLCGGELATLSKTNRIYCTACGAGLPGSDAIPVLTAQPQATPVQIAVPSEPAPRTQAHPQGQAQPQPNPEQIIPHVVHPPQAQERQPMRPPPTQAAPVPPPMPARTQAPAHVHSPPVDPGKCRICGGKLVVHPRTNETFCPACGAGLS